MLLDLNDPQRRRIGRFEIDPATPPATLEAPLAPGSAGGHPSSSQPATSPVSPASAARHARLDLHWDGCFDDAGFLRRCPACGCRELFHRRDFPQRFGLTLVIAAVIVSIILFAAGRIVWSLAVLALVALIDAMTCRFTGRCLVCYRCRSEFRGVPIHDAIEPWDLAIGEKYRPAMLQASAEGA